METKTHYEKLFKVLMSFEPLTIALAAQSEQLRQENEQLEWENKLLRSYVSRREGLLQAIHHLIHEEENALNDAICTTIEDLLGQKIEGWGGPHNQEITPIQNINGNKRFAIRKIEQLEIAFETL